MSISNPIGLADLLKAWSRLGAAYPVEDLAGALGLEVLPGDSGFEEEPEEPEVRPPSAHTARDDSGTGPEPEATPDLPESTVEFTIETVAGTVETAPGRVALVASPLAPDPEPRAVPIQPLFAPRLVRDILRRTLSTPMPSQDVDTGRLADQLSRGLLLNAIPRTRRPSLRRGVQVLRDVGDAMAPYLSDQDHLLQQIRGLLGESEVQELKTIGANGRFWDADGYVDYEPPADGRPILVFTDAGIGRSPKSEETSTRAEWAALLRRLAQSGSPIVLYLPYRPNRWPQSLQGVADITVWDRPLLPERRGADADALPRDGHDPMAIRMVSALRKRHPGVVDLATRLSLAARIEPALLRATRLRLTPWVAAGGEADLMFSSLVEARSVSGMVLRQPVQKLLQHRLAQVPAAMREAADFLREFREEQHAPEAILLEEEINRLHAANMAPGAAPDGDAMEQALAGALASMTTNDDTAGLAIWALRVLPRFPPELAATPTARSLHLHASLQSGTRAIPSELLDGDAQILRDIALPALETVPIGIRWNEDGIALSDPPEDGDQSIAVPDTHPRLLWLEDDRTDSHAHPVPIVSGESAHLPAELLARYDMTGFSAENGSLQTAEQVMLVRLRTLDGQYYSLRSQAPSPPAEELPPDAADAPKTKSAGDIFTLEILPARHGNAFLLHFGSQQDPGLILIDGGPSGTYRKVLKPRLAEIRRTRPNDDPLRLDLVMLTHIDDQQSRGIRDLMDDLAEASDMALMPDADIREFWFNERDMTESGSIRKRSAKDDASWQRRSQQLIRAARTLGALRNRSIDESTVVAGDSFVNGNIKATVVWPSPRRGVMDRTTLPKIVLQGSERRRPADRSVTNNSSLVVLFQVEDRRILITGDSRSDHILEGLSDLGLLTSTGQIHVDVLQLPHNGSDRNVHPEFFARVTADHYVAAGNGQHGNPDPATFEMLFEERRYAETPFAIHLATRLDQFDEKYPMSDMRALFDDYWNRGWNFDVFEPSLSAPSLAIELGRRTSLGEEPYRGSKLRKPVSTPPGTGLPSRALFNRSEFQHFLKEAADPKVETRIALIHGAKGTGTSYSTRFIDAEAAANDIDTHAFIIGPDTQVDELLRRLIDRLGAGADEVPPGITADHNGALKWLQDLMGRNDRPVWLVFDFNGRDDWLESKLEDLRPVLDFLLHLGLMTTRYEFSVNVRIFILGLEPDAFHFSEHFKGLGASMYVEKVSGFTLSDVEAFLGTLPENLAEEGLSRVRKFADYPEWTGEILADVERSITDLLQKASGDRIPFA